MRMMKRLLYSWLVPLVVLTLIAQASSSSSESGSTSTSRNNSPHDQQHDYNLLRRVLQKEAPNEDTPKSKVQEYEILKSAQIREYAYQWADLYPDFMKLTTAQEAYGLATAGSKRDCPHDTQVTGCLNYILVLQDFQAFPEHSVAAKELPQILWSGELHGNEQIGPTAVMEATHLLLQAASCESHPRRELAPSSSTNKSDSSESSSSSRLELWKQELARAVTCRQELRDFGMDDTHRQWLARLLATRRIVVVPTANALGYYRRQREEGDVDPNRDFPYDVRDPADCMQTVAARTLNEVFRQHQIQLALTFHAGMEVIGYEWGAPTWSGHLAPDDAAQVGIGAAYSAYGGGWSTSRPYEYGNMNQLVYPVTGGMEDWAYAASWDPDRVVACQPRTFGGYPKEKTIYNNSTLRVFNMLVETSDSKIPSSHLGTSKNLLTTGNKDNENNGHVARNIRLALLSAELVQPYVAITTVNEHVLSDDIVPLQPRDDPYSCQMSHGVTVATKLLSSSSSSLQVQWKVGGSLTIDHTEIWYGNWKDVADTGLDCWTQPNADILEPLVTKGTPLTATNGVGQFSSAAASSPPLPFAASLDLSQFQKDDILFVVAVATVDQDWMNQPANFAPRVPPQSHIVNARTNENWYHETEGSIIRGRLKWFSQPLTIRFGTITKNGTTPVTVQEILERYQEGADYDTLPDDFYPPLPFKTTTTSKKPRSNFFFAMGMLVVVSVMVLFVRAARQARYRSAHRSRVREFIKDETAESTGKRTNGILHANGKDGYSYSDQPPDDEDEEGDCDENRGVEMGRYVD